MKTKKRKVLLGVNIDHVATLRQQRRQGDPDLIEAALAVQKAGADQITVHLREDRRHIQDADIPALQKKISIPLNFEMALAPEILRFALKNKPEKVCIVPEKRLELTTEGGLDVIKYSKKLSEIIPQLKKKKIEVSLFIDPIESHVRESVRLGADSIEIHTGCYAEARGAEQKKELLRIQVAAKLGKDLGLNIHAGHGLTVDNLKAILKISQISELNIGFSIVSRALFVGFSQSMKEIKTAIQKGL